MRFAPPHRANGRPSHTWDLTTFAGAGALRSTTNDLLKLLAANLGKPSTALTEALQTCHAIQPGVFPPLGALRRIAARLYLGKRDIDHYEQSIALGWHVGQLTPEGTRVFWRHGATGGYRAFAGFIKDLGAGVVVLENRSLGIPDMILGLTSADRIGFNVLELLTSSIGRDPNSSSFSEI
jgi:CubicO group peptidase (beta-lactamase class C family)